MRIVEFPYERAAVVLAESELFGDKQTAKRWGISDRTIRNYRTRMSEDEHLAALFHLKKEALTKDWQSDATKALKVSLNKLVELVQDNGKPDQIHAVAGAVKIVGELKIAFEALTDEPGNNREG
ncbi:hypothetical protein BZZ01_04810 [Nostocales cyanobacterium HT-58-2]|nr:hypothetical protein BZZ01_04810 [Nostocales cyanobacterium HT-58-2]